MLDLGEFYPCLKVTDLEKSITFYTNLGFTLIEDFRTDGWAVMQHNNMALSLYQGHIQENMINFRGGDVAEIGRALTNAGIDFTQPAALQPDGSWSAEIRDPDGNSIFFNTYPDEREKYLNTGKLIDY